MSNSLTGFRALRGLQAFAAAACAAAIAIPAQADVNGAPFQIIAVDDVTGMTATLDITDGSWDEQGNYRWASTTTHQFFGTDGNFLGCLNPPNSPGSSFEYNGDPIVNLSFSVAAGGSSTTFMIASALMSFPSIATPSARASVSFTVTDADGDGATLTGLGGYSGTAGYTAQYNGFAGGPFGTSFAEVIPTLGPTAAFDTNSVTSTTPPVGYTPLGVAAFDMSSFVAFRLSANDLASGTSTYEIVPEPAALLLLVAGAALIRRR